MTTTKKNQPTAVPNGKPAAANAPTGPRRVESAERELGHQRRHADHDRDEDVEENERRAAELSDHVRKPPDVAESDRDADDRHQRAESRRERLAGFRARSCRGRLARFGRHSLCRHQLSCRQRSSSATRISSASMRSGARAAAGFATGAVGRCAGVGALARDTPLAELARATPRPAPRMNARPIGPSHTSRNRRSPIGMRNGLRSSSPSETPNNATPPKTSSIPTIGT